MLEQETLKRISDIFKVNLEDLENVLDQPLSIFLARVDEATLHVLNQLKQKDELELRLQECKSSLSIAEINKDSQLHALEMRRQVLEQELAQALKTTEIYQADKLTAEAKAEKSLVELQQCQAKLEQTKQEFKSCKTNQEELDKERQELLGLLTKVKAENQQLSTQLETVTLENKTLKEEQFKSTCSTQELNMNLQELKLQLKENEAHLQLSRTNLEKVNETLYEKQEQFLKLEKQRVMEVSQMSHELEVVKAENESLQNKINSIDTSNEELNRSMEKLIEQEKDLRVRLAAQDESFKSEIQTAKHLNGIWETSYKQLQSYVEQLEAEKITQKEKQEQSEKALKEELEDKQRIINKKNQELESQEGVIQQLKSELKNVNEIIGGSMSVTSVVASLAPTAVVANRVQKSGKTFTEVYHDYIKLQDRFHAEEAEKNRLKECLEELLKEIAERAPILEAQRRDYENIYEEANLMAKRLALAEDAKTKAEAALKELQMKYDHYKKEQDAIKSENESLSMQVRNLLHQQHEQERIRNPNLPPPVIPQLQQEELEGLAKYHGAQMIVRKHLTTFDSISLLHEQNLKLLRVVKEVSAKLEEERKRKDAESEKLEAVKEKEAQVEALQKELRMEQARVESFIRERDMLKAMVLQKELSVSVSKDLQEGNGEPTAASITLLELQDNFDAYRQEIGIDFKTLKKQLDIAQKDSSELRIEIAKQQAQVAFQIERYQLLLKTTESKSEEVVELRRHIAQLQELSGKQELNYQKSTHDLLTAQDQISRLRNDLSNAQSELELLRSTEKRLRQDNENMGKERIRLLSVNEDIRSMYRDLQLSDLANKTNLEQSLKNAQKELEELKTKLEKEANDYRSNLTLKEAEIKEYLNKFDQQSGLIMKLREELASSKAKLEGSESRLHDLQVENEQLRQSQTFDRPGSTGESTDLQVHLNFLKNELEAAKKTIMRKEENLEQLKAISETAELALQEVQSEYEGYKVEITSQLQQQQSSIQLLQNSRDELIKRLKETDEDLARHDEESQKKLDEVRLERDALATELAGIKQTQQSVEQVRSQMAEDIRYHARIAQEAQERYNQELLSHATDVENLGKLRQEHEVITEELSKCKLEFERASATQQSAEKSWQSQKDLLQRTIDDYQARCLDLEELNSRLLTDYESLRGSISLSISTTPTTDITLDNLRGAVGVLRNEISRASLQRDLAQHEANRLAQELRVAHYELEQVRGSLAAEREKHEVTIQAMSQHDELLSKINELNIVRESNATLRMECDRLTNNASSLEVLVASLRHEIEPLKEQLYTKQARIDGLEQEKSLLAEDRQRWRDRANNILSSKTVIDPAEYESLQFELTELKKENETVKSEFSAQKEQCEGLQKKLNEFLEANTTLREAATRWKDLAVTRKSRINALSAEITAKFQEEIKKLTMEKDSLTQAKENTDELLRQAMVERDDFKVTLERQQFAQKAESNWEVQFQEQQIRMDELIKENSELKQSLTQESSGQLQEEISRLQQNHAKEFEEQRIFYEKRAQQEVEQLEQRIKELEETNNDSKLKRAWENEDTTGGGGGGGDAVDSDQGGEPMELIPSYKKFKPSETDSESYESSESEDSSSEEEAEEMDIVSTNTPAGTAEEEEEETSAAVVEDEKEATHDEELFGEASVAVSSPTMLPPPSSMAPEDGHEVHVDTMMADDTTTTAAAAATTTATKEEEGNVEMEPMKEQQSEEHDTEKKDNQPHKKKYARITFDLPTKTQTIGVGGTSPSIKPLPTASVAKLGTEAKLLALKEQIKAKKQVDTTVTPSTPPPIAARFGRGLFPTLGEAVPALIKPTTTTPGTGSGPEQRRQHKSKRGGRGRGAAG